MKPILKSIIIAIMITSLLIQTGCWDQKLYEKIGFILQLGLEIDEEDKLLFSITSPVVAPEVESKVEFFHTSSQRLIRSSRERIRNVAGKQLRGGKTQHVYFSKELAQKGINDFFDIFFRDPQNPLLANVIVIDGSPKEMMELSLNYKDKPRTAFYVNALLEDARSRAVVPETRIYNFSILTYSKTIDPVTPLLRYNEKDILVAGSALFSGDKMVGEIDTDQTMLLNMLRGEAKEGEYIYEQQPSNESGERIKRGAVVSIGNSKEKVEINTSSEKPVIHINIKFKAFLDEYAGRHNLDKMENKENLENNVAKALKADMLQLLGYLQDVGADPVGFGEIVRVKNNEYWKGIQWKDVYKDATFNVDVSINIESYGAMQ